MIALLLVAMMSGCSEQVREEDRRDVFLISCLCDSTLDICGSLLEEYCASQSLRLEEKDCEDTGMALEEAVEAAAACGAKLCILYGFTNTAGLPALKKAGKTMRVLCLSDYAPDESCAWIGYLPVNAVCCGFMAGFVLAKTGNRRLGVLISKADSNGIDLGYGFVQGVDFVASLSAYTPYEIRYWYTGEQNGQETCTTVASSWFADGTDVIFTDNAADAACALSAIPAESAKLVFCFNSGDMDTGAGIYGAAADCLKGPFVTALDSAFSDDGSFAAYTDGTFVNHAYDVPDSFMSLPGCDRDLYLSGFRYLTGTAFGSLKDHSDGNRIGDPGFLAEHGKLLTYFFG